MSDTPETKVKKYFRKRLKSICERAGVYCRISTRGSEFGVGGEPDYDCCIGGSVYFHAEIKAPGKRVKEGSRQDAKIKEMRAGGERVVVLSSNAEVDTFFNESAFSLYALYGPPEQHRRLLKAIQDEYKTQRRPTRARPGVPSR